MSLTLKFVMRIICPGIGKTIDVRCDTLCLLVTDWVADVAKGLGPRIGSILGRYMGYAAPATTVVGNDPILGTVKIKYFGTGRGFFGDIG